MHLSQNLHILCAFKSKLAHTLCTFKPKFAHTLCANKPCQNKNASKLNKEKIIKNQELKVISPDPLSRQDCDSPKKMLESRSEDALVLLVKLVKLDC